MYRLLLVGVLGVVGALGFFTQSASALSSDPKHFIGADNTFYAYVNAGEEVSAEFIRSQYLNEGRSTDVVVTIDGPNVKQQKCTLKRDIAVGKGCIFKPIKASKTGIWKINMVPGENAKAFPTLSPDVRWVQNLFSWKIMVTNKGVEQEGRIWTDRYAFRQPPGSQFTGDFTTYYVSEDGYIYKAINREYNGQVSILLADAIGIRSGDECVSAYRSAEVSDEKLSPALGTCGNRYKLFFQEPAGNLPTQAIRWDGETEWVRPSIKRPSISELHFTHDGSNDQLSGTVSFYLRNFIGQYEIKVDVDNDGNFDGQYDVTMRQQMKNLTDGLQRIHFQGVDRRGQVIAPSQTIGIKVNITKVAEIHFVAVDVEGRGGLEVVRMNGTNAPTSALCWNDTDLSLLANATLVPNVIDGRSCPSSTGGAHGWLYNNSSWGNARYVDDWIYAKADLEGNNQIIYPEAEAKEDEANGQSLVVVAVVGVVTILLLGATVAVVAIKKRKQRRARIQQSPQPAQPVNPQPNPNNPYDGQPPVPPQV